MSAMSDKPKMEIVLAVKETAEIVAVMDRVAEREGVSRSDIARRAFRQFVFSLPKDFLEGIISRQEEQPAA
jgi:metal-responsive CopG/Arc/MetJ family transcriptional regulator